LTFGSVWSRITPRGCKKDRTVKRQALARVKRRRMKYVLTCSRRSVPRALSSAVGTFLLATSAVAADAPTLACFASGKDPAAARVASCTAALDSGLAGRARALALTLRAEAWRLSGDDLKARADLDAAVSLVPDDPELRLARGRLNSDENRTTEAEGDFSAAIAAASTRPELAGEAYALRGALRLTHGASDAGIADLGEARRLAPANSLAFKLRGTYFLAHGDPKTAIADLSEALVLTPDDLDTRRMRATAYAQLRAFPEAIADFDAVIARAPQDEAALKGRGVAALQSGAFARAEQDLTAALAVNPAIDTTFLRANARLQMGAFARAVDDFTGVLNQRPGDDEALFGRAMAYQFTGDYARGEADLDEILARAPDAAEALSKRGTIRFMQAKFKEAAVDLAHAAGLPGAPVDLVLWRFLAEARGGAKPAPPPSSGSAWPTPVLRYFRAELSGDQVIAAAGGDPGRLCETYFYLGEAAVLQGQTAEAVRLFKAARATGRTRYTEYAAAGAELARLAPPG
jgi:tetratricopeptide (TPR) repeat protein